MDWTNVELVSIPEMDEKANSEPILAGLSATPSNLHDAFLTDLPHLQEIQNAHASHLATAGEEVEAHFSVLSNLQTADTAIATLGGFREGDSLVLPLQGAIQDRVQLELKNCFTRVVNFQKFLNYKKYRKNLMNYIILLVYILSKLINGKLIQNLY